MNDKPNDLKDAYAILLALPILIVLVIVFFAFYNAVGYIPIITEFGATLFGLTAILILYAAWRNTH